MFDAAAIASARRTSVLGRSIARLMVEAHGGRIWVESTPGHGATFLLSLPVQPQDSK